MRVQLLNPNFTLKAESRNEFSLFPPLGLAYLAALLERAGHEVEVLDLNLGLDRRGRVLVRPHGEHFRFGLRDEEIVERIASFRPDVVGVSSIFTPFYRDAMRVTALAKRAAPSARTVLGGAHVSMEYRAAIAEPSVDAVIRGEGELPFTALVTAWSEGRAAEGIPGVVYKDADGRVRDQGPGEQVADLDTLPLPAYHRLDMAYYVNDRERNFAYAKRHPIGHLITSRGCPYTCIFCSTRNFFPNYRVNSPTRVLEEIRFLQARYGVREIHFHDDAFLIQRKRVRQICERLIAENVDVSWQISQGVNINLLTKELLVLMRRSGMYRLGLPIESGSPRTLEYIRKVADLDHARAMIQAANEVGIFTHANFIIGFPYETEEDLRLTHEFAATCGVDFLKILVCQPLAGAELWDVYKREGLLGDGRDFSTYTSTEYGSKHFTAAELNRRRRAILWDFQRRRLGRVVAPSRFKATVLPKIRDREALAYFSRLVYRSTKSMLLRANAGH